MNQIDTRNWFDIPIGNLFTVVKGTRLTKADMREGDIKFIGASAVNNGITAFISNSGHVHPGNTVTITYNGSVGEAFYQEDEFWASDDVNVLYPKFTLNAHIALFIIPLLKKAGQKYEFIDKWKKEDMEKDCIKIPVDENHEPDFSYMETYMKKSETSVSEALTKLQSAKRYLQFSDIGLSSWKPFIINDIFPQIIKPTVYHTREVKQDENGIPYVVRSKFNNGVKYTVHKPSGTINPAKVISFGAENATFFYQRTEWVSGRDMYYIDTTGLSEYACLFITACLQPVAEKYSYNYGLFPELLKKEKIILPANEDGTPDYDYMESYIKTIESQANTSLKRLCSVL